MILTMGRSGEAAVEAVVLAIGASRMRVQPAGGSDAIELNSVDGTWKDDSGATVVLDFAGALSSDAVNLCWTLLPLTSAVAR